MGAVVNWSISGHLIDELLQAGVVVNCPPFRGQMTALPSGVM
jgi:hypothetical protein